MVDEDKKEPRYEAYGEENGSGTVSHTTRADYATFTTYKDARSVADLLNAQDKRIRALEEQLKWLMRCAKGRGW
jgi:hypothetical protein